jgi:hypothetical protein
MNISASHSIHASSHSFAPTLNYDTAMTVLKIIGVVAAIALICWVIAYIVNALTKKPTLPREYPQEKDIYEPKYETIKFSDIEEKIFADVDIKKPNELLKLIKKTGEEKKQPFTTKIFANENEYIEFIYNPQKNHLEIPAKDPKEKNRVINTLIILLYSNCTQNNNGRLIAELTGLDRYLDQSVFNWTKPETIHLSSNNINYVPSRNSNLEQKEEKQA